MPNHCIHIPQAYRGALPASVAIISCSGQLHSYTMSSIPEPSTEYVDLSGLAATAQNNPYDTLIEACEDDSVILLLIPTFHAFSCLLGPNPATL